MLPGDFRNPLLALLWARLGPASSGRDVRRGADRDFPDSFFIEFIKLDQEAFEQGMLLNMGQLLSIPFILVGIYMIYRGMHRSPVDPDTVRVVRQQTVRQQGGSSKPRKHRRMK